MFTTKQSAISRDRRAQRLGLLVCLLVVLASLAVAWPAAAQTSPFTLDVRAGFDGAYRSGEWFPVTVELANSGPDVRAVLEWDFPGQPGEMRFQRAVDLPNGARKRVSMAVLSRGFARNGRMRLLDGDTPVAEQNVRIIDIDPTMYLVGVISDDATLLNSLDALQIANYSSADVRHVTLDMLPDQAAALMALNALFLHNVDTSSLRDTQRAALQLWVQQGGQLIVSGGTGAAQTIAGVDPLLPITVAGSLGAGSLARLATLGGAGGLPAGESVPLSTGQLRTGTEALLGDSNDPASLPLLYRQTVGSGSVIFTAFDIAELRDWRGETALWQNLLGAQADARATPLTQRDNLLRDTLRQPASQLPSAGLLLVLLATYLLMIGPINYIVLRRMGRLELAWLTIPATVLVFSTAFYVVGFGLRSGQTQLQQIAIVQGTEHQVRGTATAYIGLFSPRRARYDLALPGDTLVSQLRSWIDGGGDDAVILVTDADVRINDLLVDVGSLRTIAAQRSIELPLRVESTVRTQRDAVRGDVRNVGTTTLEDALIVSGLTFQPLGTLNPGDTAQVDFSTATQNFPWSVNAGSGGAFNRQPLLNALFSRSREQRIIDDRGVYLLAWRSEATIPVQLDGQEAPQEGLTLYVIRLSDT